jgi:Protein kinase domain
MTEVERKTPPVAEELDEDEMADATPEQELDPGFARQPATSYQKALKLVYSERLVCGWGKYSRVARYDKRPTMAYKRFWHPDDFDLEVGAYAKLAACPWSLSDNTYLAHEPVDTREAVAYDALNDTVVAAVHAWFTAGSEAGQDDGTGDADQSNERAPRLDYIAAAKEAELCDKLELFMGNWLSWPAISVVDALIADILELPKSAARAPLVERTTALRLALEPVPRGTPRRALVLCMPRALCTLEEFGRVRAAALDPDWDRIWPVELPVYTAAELEDVVWKMTCCVAHAHQAGLIHMDIALKNFLVVPCDVDAVHGTVRVPSRTFTDWGAPRTPLMVCMCDWGSRLDPGTPLATGQRYCTPDYRPPELFMGTPGCTANAAIDAWSLGVCIVDLLRHTSMPPAMRATPVRPAPFAVLAQRRLGITPELSRIHPAATESDWDVASRLGIDAPRLSLASNAGLRGGPIGPEVARNIACFGARPGDRAARLDDAPSTIPLGLVRLANDLMQWHPADRVRPIDALFDKANRYWTSKDALRVALPHLTREHPFAELYAEAMSMYDTQTHRDS